MMGSSLRLSGFLQWIAVSVAFVIGTSNLTAQPDNLRLPRMKFDKEGEYDTLAYEIAQERSKETAGLMEREIDPETYLLGPDDVLLLSVFTSKYKEVDLTVSPEGKLLIPDVGVISVKGKTLAEAEQLVVEKAKRYYRTAEVALSLQKLRSFKVNIMGAVRKPATVEASAADRVSEVIDRAGGHAHNGSLRRIRLFRRDQKEPILVDLRRFYSLGDLDANPTVLGGDVIMVGAFSDEESQTIGISGAVSLPEIYEYVDGDMLSTIIRFAGGFQPSAKLDSVELARFQENSSIVERIWIDVSDWQDILNNAEALPNDLPLKPGDRVFVRAIPNWLKTQRVVIEGEVRYPGEYPINSNTSTLSDLVERAGGFTEDASLEGALLVRDQDIRLEDDKEFQRLSSIPPSEMSERELRYYRARGAEFRGLMTVDFKSVFLDGNKETDIALRLDDSVYVPAVKNYINVLGRVNSPGRVVFKPGLSFLDYIGRAGGFGYRADEGETLIIKPKGEFFLAETLNYVLEPGDNILVPEEPDTKFIDVFTEALTIATQLVTVAGVIITITRLN